MAKRKSAGTDKSVQPRKGGPPPIVQEALQVTWLLKGNLKNAQLGFIRVGKLLARVRDDKLFAALKHPDMEHYAAERLHLGRTSLYRYLQLHDWVAETHKEWLLPHPKGFIPDLNDVADLMYIEKELARPDLKPSTKAALAELKTKALSGDLKKSELAPYRRKKTANPQWRKAYLSKLRALRSDGAKLAGMPAEVITHLEAAINILSHATVLSLAGMEDAPKAAKNTAA